MNLINEPWIPIRRADGAQGKIEPWRLTDHPGGTASPIMAVASPRPDFDGALIQFLIGLLQTTCTPETEGDWWDWREVSPPPETLKARFGTVAFAFDLEGEKAFMQDFSPKKLESELDIDAMLVEAPGEQTLAQNKDHFVKRGVARQLCDHCAAAALFCLQTNAPSGGRGYRTGLRGGGPLTTLVLGATLWETCWLNVLAKDLYLGDGLPENRGDADRFPWLASTRVSDPKNAGSHTYPVDVHPDQQFWAMPRRIRLVRDKVPEMVSCQLCGTDVQWVYRRFRTRNYGVEYEGFEHSLSPHYAKDSAINAVHPQPGGIGYRHWLGLVENSTDGATERRPAKVIRRFRSLREDGRLWAFGYDMDKRKARCWYDATMPVLSIEEALAPILKGWVERLVHAAGWVADKLRKRLKQRLFSRAEVRGDLGFVQATFWQASERGFYQHLRQLRDAVHTGGDAHPIAEHWLGFLRSTALAIFDNLSQTGEYDAVDPRKVATTRNALAKDMAGRQLREKILGLPKAQRKKNQARAGEPHAKH